MNKSILLAAAALTAALPWSGANAQRHDGRGGVVRCESIKERLQHCPLDSRADVQLLKRLSDSACVEGRTWGRDQGGIWVADGCRGEFLVGGHGGGWQGSGGTLRCESEGNRHRQCPADVRGGVQLVRQLSDSACIEGRTWGRDHRGIWVSNGCRAEFRIGAGQGQGPGWPGASTAFRCESEDERSRHCRANARGRVVLVRQLSKASCIEGRTWGQDRDGVWVDAGCRGEFRVYEQGNNWNRWRGNRRGN